MWFFFVALFCRMLFEVPNCNQHTHTRIHTYSTYSTYIPKKRNNKSVAGISRLLGYNEQNKDTNSDFKILPQKYTKTSKKRSKYPNLDIQEWKPIATKEYNLEKEESWQQEKEFQESVDSVRASYSERTLIKHQIDLVDRDLELIFKKAESLTKFPQPSIAPCHRIHSFNIFDPIFETKESLENIYNQSIGLLLMLNHLQIKKTTDLYMELENVNQNVSITICRDRFNHSNIIKIEINKENYFLQISDSLTWDQFTEMLNKVIHSFTEPLNIDQMQSFLMIYNTNSQQNMKKMHSEIINIMWPFIVKLQTIDKYINKLDDIIAKLPTKLERFVRNQEIIFLKAAFKEITQFYISIFQEKKEKYKRKPSKKRESHSKELKSEFEFNLHKVTGDSNASVIMIVPWDVHSQKLIEKILDDLESNIIQKKFDKVKETCIQNIGVLFKLNKEDSIIMYWIARNWLVSTKEGLPYLQNMIYGISESERQHPLNGLGIFCCIETGHFPNIEGIPLAINSLLLLALFSFISWLLGLILHPIFNNLQ